MNEERRISGARRPLAWVVVVILAYLSDVASGLLCELGIWLSSFLAHMTPFQIVICMVLFGGTFVGLAYYALSMIPLLIVYLCDRVYPSNHAFRYYFVGVCTIIVSACCILMAIFGLITSDTMFWVYARYVYMIIHSVWLMVIGRSNAEDRQKAS